MKEIKVYQLGGKVKLTKKLVNSINKLLAVLSSNVRPVDISILRDLVASPLLEIFIVEVDGKIIGMASLYYIRTLGKNAAYVEDVVVHPDFQGQGLGKKIMNHLIKRAKERKVDFLELTSSPKRVAANKLYKKLGFELRETNVYRMKL